MYEDKNLVNMKMPYHEAMDGFSRYV